MRLGIFAAVAMATLALANRLLPKREDLIHARIASLPEGPIDLVFLGSSYTDYNIDTAVFDRELARLGHPLRSANLGMVGSTEFDKEFLIRKAAPRLAEARYIVDEILRWETYRTEGGWKSTRNIEWHDLRALADAVAFEWRRPEPFRRRVKAIGINVALTFSHYNPAGRLGRSNRVDPDVVPLNWQSALPLGMYGPAGSRSWNTRAAQFRREVEANNALRARPYRELRPYEPERVRRRMEVLKSLGPELVLVSSPSPIAGNRRIQKSAALAAPAVPVLNYDDPVRHADLWAVENRFDTSGHLNRAGVELYSRRLAYDFVAVVLGEYEIER